MLEEFEILCSAKISKTNTVWIYCSICLKTENKVICMTFSAPLFSLYG